MPSSSRDPGQQPVSALLGADCERVVRMIAETDWDPDALSCDALNVRYGRGSLPKELRQSAAAAIRTLRAIILDARLVVADGALGRQDGPVTRSGMNPDLPTPTQQGSDT